MMPPRRPRARWRVLVPATALVLVVLASLLAGVVYAAHRDPTYRRSVNAAFDAEAGALVVASNETGRALAATLSHPGGLGRVLLSSQLEQLSQQAATEALEAAALQSPPPSDNAAAIVIDTLRLRARAVATIADALDRLLGLPAGQPVGSARRLGVSGHPIGVPGAEGLLRQAGRELVLADETYARLAARSSSLRGAGDLPESRWTAAAAGVLTPTVLRASAPLLVHNPRLAATVRVVITAIETQPIELPLGPGYPVTPTRTFDVGVSIRNIGTAATNVTAIISVRPLGALGRPDSGRASGVVAGGAAVALLLPSMAVVPGEHCLVTVELVKPPYQQSTVGLRWRRTVVVASD